MQQRNATERVRLRNGRSKISDSDLANLRASGPWELLQQNLRSTFNAELAVAPFREEYHSCIQVEVVKGKVEGFKLDEALVDVGPLDCIRVAPATARAFEAGTDGLEFLALGSHHPGDGEPVEDPWTDR